VNTAEYTVNNLPRLMVEVQDRPDMEGAGKMGGSCRLSMKKSLI